MSAQSAVRAVLVGVVALAADRPTERSSAALALAAASLSAAAAPRLLDCGAGDGSLSRRPRTRRRQPSGSRSPRPRSRAGTRSTRGSTCADTPSRSFRGPSSRSLGRRRLVRGDRAPARAARAPRGRPRRACPRRRALLSTPYHGLVKNLALAAFRFESALRGRRRPHPFLHRSRPCADCSNARVRGRGDRSPRPRPGRSGRTRVVWARKT